ncbi:CopG family transcriptional regulator [Streptococcus mitis 29/42]|uniref:CopG family transcriptional regulator n=1 Tax=Streptococcus mitis 29/42 TaxID=1340486 RepID=S7XLL5_STRMT|nr:CopG family transcriptional regulator [Streptococcus mitis 29/42]
MATDKNRIMISLDDKNLEKLENLVEDARDRRGMRLTKSQVIELLLNTVDYFDDIMGAIYSKNNSINAIIFLQIGVTLVIQE